VLGVCLDCAHDGSGEIGVARCSVDRADGWGADFYYGLGTWGEMVEEEEIEYGDGREGGEGDDEELDVEVDKEESEMNEGPVRVRGMFGVYSLVQEGELQHPTHPLSSPMFLIARDGGSLMML
jgi:hypothetical protein